MTDCMISAAIIVLAVCLCGCNKYHEEIVDATRDDEMSAWLDKHNLRIVDSIESFQCTAIYFEKKEAKEGESK